MYSNETLFTKIVDRPDLAQRLQFADPYFKPLQLSYLQLQPFLIDTHESIRVASVEIGKM